MTSPVKWSRRSCRPRWCRRRTAYPPNRLGLARWLVDPSNPLMARVTVNRFWQMYFGTGIVKTDRGFRIARRAAVASRAARLAGDRVRANRLGRESAAEDDRDERDLPAGLAPAVRSCWRRIPTTGCSHAGRTLRLSADIVRDQALAIAGLLVNKIGGPSVKPYQPDGLWNEIGGGGAYVQDHGDNLYRRSLYTFWRRIDSAAVDGELRRVGAREPHGQTGGDQYAAAGARPDERCGVCRRRRACLRSASMKEGGATPPERIAYAFRVATARRPKAAEIAILLDAFAQNLEIVQGEDRTRP